MKHIITLFFLIVTYNVASQENITFTPKWIYESFFGLPNYSKKDQYRKIVDWTRTEKHADMVIVHKIKNELIIIEGSVPNYLTRTLEDNTDINYTLKFTLVITIKESFQNQKYIHDFFLLENGSNSNINFSDFISSVDGASDREGKEYKGFVCLLIKSLFQKITRE